MSSTLATEVWRLGLFDADFCIDNSYYYVERVIFFLLLILVDAYGGAISCKNEMKLIIYSMHVVWK